MPAAQQLPENDPPPVATEKWTSAPEKTAGLSKRSTAVTVGRTGTGRKKKPAWLLPVETLSATGTSGMVVAENSTLGRVPLVATRPSLPAPAVVPSVHLAVATPV